MSGIVRSVYVPGMRRALSKLIWARTTNALLPKSILYLITGMTIANGDGTLTLTRRGFCPLIWKQRRLSEGGYSRKILDWSAIRRPSKTRYWSNRRRRSKSACRRRLPRKQYLTSLTRICTGTPLHTFQSPFSSCLTIPKIMSKRCGHVRWNECISFAKSWENRGHGSIYGRTGMAHRAQRIDNLGTGHRDGEYGLEQ
jgi:hypothetical protein